MPTYDFEVNVSKLELQRALEFAEENGLESVRLHFSRKSGIGCSIRIGEPGCGDETGYQAVYDITDYESW